MSRLKIKYNRESDNNLNLIRKISLILATIILICIFLPKQARFRYEFQKGKVWDHENLISPYNFAILKTQEELNEDKKNILKTIQPIYDVNSTISREQIDQFETDLAERWQTNKLDTTPQKIQDYRAVGNAILSHLYDRGILSLNNRFQNRNDDKSPAAKQYNFTLIQDKVATQKNTADCYTIESSYEYANSVLNNSSKIVYKKWLLETLKNYITLNYVYNDQQTERLEQTALANISSTRGVVQKGELIAEKDKIISNETYQKLESLRKIYEDEGKISGNQTYVTLGQFLIISLALSILLVFLYLFRKDIYYNNRLLSIIMIVIIGMLGALSWAIKIKIPNLYYIPFCSVPIIIRILFDSRVALNIHLLMVLLAALFVPNSYEFVFLQFMAGIVAIYSIKTLVKREQFFISSAIILATYLIAYFGLLLTRNGSLSTINIMDVIPFVVSVMITLMAYPLVYAFEKLFGIVSDLTLMELTNSNSKLLRELSFKAPGTFQHSLQVANLAEAAIYRIGGNPLLVRAGALYHDIGKITNPQFFIENQKTEKNPHDELSPEQSAQIIISHVIKGVEIAKRNQLPDVIIDFIKTHHGTTKVDYFYNLFIKNNPDKLVDESLYQYPGPIPYSKETAVLMMADSVEAASRALKEHTEESINTLVDKIIEHKLKLNQFANSNITLKEITESSNIFKAMLKSIYHVRVDYDLSKKK
ncbi:MULTISPECIES: HD family phosphohydrolase [Sphingobacterium]|uniref:HD family phosphohydrolase n=1 Tax=Sphingobacterium TaxID=28453 RepID=UPI000B9A6917|nr:MULTISPECIES: HDIG domain-containing metalloprotein [Sphingobacterium]UXD70551.1 HDIG domain-containing protein [Sphingobacterium faecium]WGQ14123.1 HDIG domain-containing protein [Sphingobacterium faecium]HCU45789.1 HDIG domain-containing protein [Sphingobacterium sp.]